MEKKQQTTLTLRLLGGGYLAYLGWDLYSTSAGDLRFRIAAGVFALVGIALLGNSLWTIFKQTPKTPPEKEK